MHQNNSDDEVKTFAGVAVIDVVVAASDAKAGVVAAAVIVVADDDDDDDAVVAAAAAAVAAFDRGRKIAAVSFLNQFMIPSFEVELPLKQKKIERTITGKSIEGTSCRIRKFSTIV